MNFSLAVLLMGLAFLLVVLAWVGWRYFLPRSVAAFSESAFAPSRFAMGVAVAGAANVVTAPSRVPRPSWLNWAGDRFLLSVLLVAACAVVGVLAVSHWVVPDPLAAARMDRQDHIELALNPERLVPPPALPPSMFISSERPALETADRDWAKLDPRFTVAVLQVFRSLETRGYQFALLEGYRSPERQEKLAAMGVHVTNARAFQSRHQFGLAADVAPIRNGRLVISERDPWAMKAYEALGEEAERLGLTWGGRWAMKDFGHIEARNSAPANGSR